jgi:predicted RecA/RadA family phage recombinase
LTVDADLLGDITGVTAGSGLSGGGTNGDVTIDVNVGTGLEIVSDNVRIANTGVTATTYGTASQTPSFTVNAQGQLTGASQQSINITASQVSDFSEAVDDRIGNLIIGGDNVTVTYDDGVGTFTIDADLAGDITGVLAGAGLTGGGSSGDVTVAIDYADTWKGNIIPDTNVAYDLGSATARWNDLYLSGNTIFLGAGNVHTDGTNLKFNGSNVFVSGTTGFDTDDLSEGSSNLYFSNARVRAAVSASLGSAGYNASTGVFSIPNSTTDIGEGTNLYYTQARFNTAFSGKSTTDLSEGTNQYYTTARANAAILDYDGDISPANANITGTFTASGVTYPSSDGTASQVLTTNGNGTLSFQSVSAIGLTSVTGGDGLTATPGIGSVELDVGAGYGITVNADNVEVSNTDIRALFSAGGDLSYNASTGVFSFTNDAGDIESVTAGTGLSGGGASGAVTLSLNHLGLETLVDPNDDRILFWDDSAGSTGWLDAGTGISISGATMSVNMGAFSTSDLSEGTNEYYTVARANTAIDARVTKTFVDALNVDADTLDGINSSAFLRSNAADSHSGTITPSSDNSIDLGSNSLRYNEVYAVTFRGTATSAQYADLAENYLGDAKYEVGTVVEFGGTAEVTASSKESSPAVAGVVSTDPAYLMNAGLEGDNIVTVALRGRVPCKVYGPVRKGDVLIASEKPGLAKAAPFRGYQTPAACIIGKAISEHRGMAEGVVEILV